MTKQQMAWILGGVTFSMLGAGGAMVGCSSGTTTDGGADSAIDNSTGQDVNNNNDTGTNDAGGDAPSCTIPGLHPGPGGDIFGGFGCDAGQQCCLGGSTGSNTFAPEMCATWGGACNNPVDGGSPIECEQTQDCEANGKTGFVCCLQGASNPSPITGCPSTDLKSSGGKGIFCEQTSCTGSGDLQICESQAECGDAGKVCTPFHWKIYQLGFCM
jgi:hypothetical protein